ncbi:hypothetical protein EV194_106128 [Natronoflexus pectinivorans]|uniref:Uncharacterized protein n=1 Tax=Natronoflexus pectinivorans TaxID=682526 RepID=A0A4R2GHW4_9BACT|nr:hypothetical protein EV194_106128 [Natronoflexus pectinivorans]
MIRYTIYAYILINVENTPDFSISPGKMAIKNFNTYIQINRIKKLQPLSNHSNTLSPNKFSYDSTLILYQKWSFKREIISMFHEQS